MPVQNSKQAGECKSVLSSTLFNSTKNYNRFHPYPLKWRNMVNFIYKAELASDTISWFICQDSVCFIIPVITVGKPFLTVVESFIVIPCTWAEKKIVKKNKNKSVQKNSHDIKCTKQQHVANKQQLVAC